MPNTYPCLRTILLFHEIISEVENFLKYQEKEAQMNLLKKQIDMALEDGDKEAFLTLSDELNRLKLKLNS